MSSRNKSLTGDVVDWDKRKYPGGKRQLELWWERDLKRNLFKEMRDLSVFKN